ncbi:MAG: leucine-rich repeat domain-containing protein, partial [Lachnospiraceae bacterium]|nr:leucine-rich repeat domain-containing protein [Lachnospiraceae bacterium]
VQYLEASIKGIQPLRVYFFEKGGVVFRDKSNSLIQIANKIDEIPCGQHHRFTLFVSGGEKQEVFWHSSRPDIARIDAKTGEMTAMGEGRVRVWVTDCSGRVKDTACFKIIPELTEEEINALYWNENDNFMRDGTVYWNVWGEREKLILPENAVAIVNAFSSCKKAHVQVRIPSSVRAISYDDSMDEQWGLFCGEHVTVSVDGNNRNYYSLFGVLFSYAFEHPVNPDATRYEVDFLFSADCKYRALLLYPPDRKNEVYYVPDGVERIAGRAFEGAKYLRRVVLPDTVKEIGSGAFDGCDQLEEIVIPASVVTIEDNGYVDAIDAAPAAVEMGTKAKITIVTPKGSAAQAYAIEHGIAYRNE